MVVHLLQRLRHQLASYLTLKQGETECPQPSDFAFFPHPIVEVLLEVVVFHMVYPGEYRVIAVLARVELLSVALGVCH